MKPDELPLSIEAEQHQQYDLRHAYLLSLMAALELYRGEQDPQISKGVLAKLQEFSDDESIDCDGIQNYLRAIVDKDLADLLFQVRCPDVSAQRSDDVFDIIQGEIWVWERIFDLSREENRHGDGPEYFDYREMAMAKLSMVSQPLYRFFKEKLTPLKFVLDGNVKALMSKVEDHLELLFEVQFAYDHMGRAYTCTPLEAIFKVNDPWMFEAIAPLIKKRHNGEALLQAQFDNVFMRAQRSLNKDEEAPGTAKIWEEALAAKEHELENDCFDFSAITNAIKIASPENVRAALVNPGTYHGSPLDNELASFRLAFHNKAIRELHANPFHLLKAFEIFDSSDLDGLTRNKYDLFWIQVIGYVERYLAAVDKQTFHQSLDETIKIRNNALQSNNRLLRFQNGFRVSLLNVSNSSGLGLNYAGWKGGLELRGTEGRGAFELRRDALRKLISSKKYKFIAIMQPKHILQTICVIS